MSIEDFVVKKEERTEKEEEETEKEIETKEKRTFFPRHRIRKIAKERFGEIKISEEAIDRLNEILVDTLETILAESERFMRHAKRKILKKEDIEASISA